MRVVPLLLLAILVPSQFAVAATFQAQTQVDYRVVEYLDGTTTTVTKSGPITFVLTTDFAQIEWSMMFDVDIVMAGGIAQPFETRLQAQGVLSTDGPSQLSFPDASGKASAGRYNLDGTAEWVLSERIVTATDVHESGPQVLDYSYDVPHSLIVNSAPSYVTLVHNVSSSGHPIIPIGRITNGNDYIEASITEFQNPHYVALQEILLGDYNDNGEVDSADYTMWRDAMESGATSLSKEGDSWGTVDEDDFLFWRDHFGETLGSGSGSAATTAVPEPGTLGLAFFAWLILCASRRHP